MNDTIGNRLSVAAIASKKQTNFPTTALAGSGGPGCLRSDAGNDLAAPSHELADTRAQVVVRIRDDRVFYTDPRAARIRPAPPPAATGSASVAPTTRPAGPSRTSS